MLKINGSYIFGDNTISIFLLKNKTSNYTENLKNLSNIFYSIYNFHIFYIIRDRFISDNILSFYQNFEDLYSKFLIALKFYIRGLFFPFEHIYIYADNYEKDFSLLFYFFFNFFIFINVYSSKTQRSILIIVIGWISASLSIPILFNLIEYGFPLISKLAERYQYSSTPALSILLSWFFIKLINKKYLNTLISGVCAITFIFFTLITLDRSKVYKNNITFFTKAHENSPNNAHEYFFSAFS